MLAKSEQLYEAAQFGIDNDSLEKRELRRSGPTAIPEVQAARDAFFSQKTYLARGCDSDFAFDGNPETFFDAQSRTYFGSQRIEDGCLRVDFGGVIDADTVEIVCFAADTPTDDVLAQCYPEAGSCSVDFAGWTATAPMEKSVIEEHLSPRSSASPSTISIRWRASWSASAIPSATRACAISASPAPWTASTPSAR